MNINSNYVWHQAYKVETYIHSRVILMRYVRNWPWFALSLALAGAIAYVYLLYQSPVYTAKVSIRIKAGEEDISGAILTKQNPFIPGNVAEKEQEIIKSYTLIDTCLLQKREEVRLSATTTLADSRTSNTARMNRNPVKPDEMMIFALFAAIGLIIPIVALPIKDALNNRVLRRADIEKTTQVPILGEIVRGFQVGIDDFIFKPRMQSVIGEQIRALRTNLQFLRSDPHHSQVLLFTSSISGEGKSFISLNLGASLSLVGLTTVILEMDMRKPKLHQILHMENRAGLSNYLNGDAIIDELLRPIIGYENYFIITSGPIPPNPAELLGSPRLDQLFDELKARFDYVMVDSPPVGLVTDSQLIAPFANNTIFVVRHDYTPKSYLKMVDTLYRDQRFQKLSIILNGVGEGESYCYNYRYGGGTDRKRRLFKAL